MWIISGPTCVGKSTFIKNKKYLDLTDLHPGTQVLFPKDLFKEHISINEDFILHYNFHRLFYDEMRKSTPIKRFLRFLRILSEDENLTEKLKNVEFSNDIHWRQILRFPAQKKAIVLLANANELKYRVSRRRVTKDKGKQIISYDSKAWLEIYNQLDLFKIYSKWCNELTFHGIQYILLDSTSLNYQRINVSQVAKILKNPKSDYDRSAK